MVERTVGFVEPFTQEPVTTLDAQSFYNRVTPQALLSVRNLSVRFSTARGQVSHPLNGVSFQIRPRETVGVLGESGAGKTTLALALLRLLPPGAQACGEIEFEGRRLLSLGNKELRELRGSQISLIYQNSSVLNPVIRVGDQLVEVLRAHFRWPKARYRERALALLSDVELRDAERIYKAYPHQLSGGQRQRVVIAFALACEPSLVIADEPTSSLDPETSAEIIDLFLRFKRRLRTSFLFISHDLGPLAQVSDRIMVMYAGRIIEQGVRDEVLQNPLHPYTHALLACSLSRREGEALRRKQLLPVIAGSLPDCTQVRPGCDFEPRCGERMNVCRERIPEEVVVVLEHSVRCFKGEV